MDVERNNGDNEKMYVTKALGIMKQGALLSHAQEGCLETIGKRSSKRELLLTA